VGNPNMKGKFRHEAAAPTAIATEEKMQMALELRKGGATYLQIGQQIGCTKKYAWDLIQRGLARMRDETAESAKELRQIELLRLEAMHLALWPQKGKVKEATVLLHIAERRARLLGLDAPLRLRPDMGDPDDPGASGFAPPQTAEEAQARIEQLLREAMRPAAMLEAEAEIIDEDDDEDQEQAAADGDQTPAPPPPQALPEKKIPEIPRF